jgi:hypothetical protein
MIAGGIPDGVRQVNPDGFLRAYQSGRHHGLTTGGVAFYNFVCFSG